MLSKNQGQLVEWSTLANGLWYCGQQFHHVVFDEQRASEDTQDIKYTSFKVQVSGFVLYCTLNHSSKLTLWDKVHDLTEYVFPFIHLSEILSINTNILNSNRGQLFQASISCNLAA